MHHSAFRSGFQLAAGLLTSGLAELSDAAARAAALELLLSHT